MPKFEGRDVREDACLSRKFSAIAKFPVKIYVDWHPVHGKKLLLYWKGRFIMMLDKDDGPHRKWVYDHFQKVRSQWYKKHGKKTQLDPIDREVEYQEKADEEDWEREVDYAANHVFDGRVSVIV